MKSQYLTLQSPGWEAIVFLDENYNNLILFKKMEEQEWYPAMYWYYTKRIIAECEDRIILEENKYLILSVLFAMIQEDILCERLLAIIDNNQQRIPEEKFKQYTIKFGRRYDSYDQTNDFMD